MPAQDKILHLLRSPQGKIFISILWGLGLATLFKVVCKGKGCVVFKAPDRKEMTSGVYHHGDDCYKFSTKTEQCTEDAVKH